MLRRTEGEPCFAGPLGAARVLARPRGASVPPPSPPLLLLSTVLTVLYEVTRPER